MILLVVQENRFYKMPNGEVWVDQQSDRKFWDRYLRVFDQVIVCARMTECAEKCTQGLVRSDCSGVAFLAMPDFHGVRGLLQNIKGIVRAIRSAIRKSDCVSIRAPSPISMVAYPLVRISRKPLICEIMNNPATHFSKHAMNNWYQPFICSVMTHQTRSMCRKANGVSYVTSHVLQELYPSTARIRGESPAYFESHYSTLHLEAQAYHRPCLEGRLPERVTFIHVGKMEDNRKGQDVFIQTLAKLQKKGFCVEGILVGDGSMRGAFEELATSAGVGENIEFVGWKAGYQEVQHELLRAQIALFPSLGEGLPRATIEAMANGLLCIGTGVDGMVELLDEELIAEENSADAFVERIIPFLCSLNNMNNMRMRLFQRAQTYEHSILSARRTVFYQKLRTYTEQKQGLALQNIRCITSEENAEQ